MEQLAQRKKKIVIGVSGASGTIYAINLVKKLKEYPMVCLNNGNQTGFRIHLGISRIPALSSVLPMD